MTYDRMRENGIVDILGNVIVYMSDNLSENIIDYFFQNGIYENIDNENTLFCEIDGFGITFIY